jgi:carbon starvation protein
VIALVTLVPLIWLLAVTMTAGVQKIFHSDPRIGFLKQAKILAEKQPVLGQALQAAKAAGEAAAIKAAEKAAHTNQILRFNNLLDAAVAGTFLVLVAAIVLLSVREWILLLARRKLAILNETPPVWLPEYAVAEADPMQATALLALAFALLKELSGQAHLERAQEAQNCCACKAEPDRPPSRSEGQIYVEATDDRFNGVRRCC